jgi:2-polyprenyl-6-methoxyphenol hydroxylase-like FAD-dependent oxidoreductase
VARAVDAPVYDARPPLACYYYSYWSGVPMDAIEGYTPERRAIIAFPTNDGLVCIIVGWPPREFPAVRADVEGNLRATIDLAPRLAERVRAGRREERFVGTADLPNFFRKPHGSGWALVGDAGYHKDPRTAQGISDAFRDAELLADALDAGLGGSRPLDDALAEYERQRNAAALPDYEYTCRRADLEQPPAPEMARLVAALRGNQEAINRFVGVVVGTVPFRDFFNSQSLEAILAQARREPAEQATGAGTGR